MISFTLISTFCALLVNGQHQLFYTLTFTRAVVNPDGAAYGKEGILVNGLFPGPTIYGNVGDEITINVVNNMRVDEGLSVHWHGIDQVGTPW